MELNEHEKQTNFEFNFWKSRPTESPIKICSIYQIMKFMICITISITFSWKHPSMYYSCFPKRLSLLERRDSLLEKNILFYQMGLHNQDPMFSLALHHLKRRKASFKLKIKTASFDMVSILDKIVCCFVVPQMQSYTESLCEIKISVCRQLHQNMMGLLHGILYSRVPWKMENGHIRSF